MTAAYHNTSNLRLQVQTTPPALPNLFLDPDATLGTWGLSLYPGADVSCVLTSDLTKYTAGSGSSTALALWSPFLPVAGGQYVRVRYTVTAITAGHTLRTRYMFRAADGTVLSTTTASAPTVSSSISYGDVIQAPAGTTTIQLLLNLYKSTSAVVDTGATVSFNKVMLTYAATSGALAAPFAYADPVTWANILGPTHSIDVDRHALDVGTLNATVLDATLDPSVTGNLNQGDAVRLQALVSSVWEDVFIGQIDDARVTYSHDPRDNSLRTSITISALDNIAGMANSHGVNGYGTVPRLAKGLTTVKGAVPFIVDGSRNYLSNDSVLANFNPDASMLDQVVITRDSVQGYAWIDRHNVINARTTLNTIANPSAAVDVSNWASSATLTRDGTYGYGPAGAFKLVTAAGSGAGTGYAYPNQGTGFVTAGADTYVIEFWVFGTGSCYVQIYSNPAGTQFAISSTITLTGTWQKITLVGTAPAGTTSIYPVIRQASAGAQTLYFDEVNLTPFGGNFTDVAGGTSPAYYSDITVGWNRDEVINSVGLTWLHSPGAGQPVEEVEYGPYDSGELVQKNARKRTFVIQGETESSTAIAALAASYLAANKNPIRKATEVVLPVKNAASFATAATLDHYDRVGVKFSTLIDTPERITSVKHQIETDRWITTYGLAAEGTAAA